MLVIHSYKYSYHIEPLTPGSHSGVEKNNDDGKWHYFSSNRHDAAAEIVCADEGGSTVRRTEGGGTVRRAEGGGTEGQTVAAQEGRRWRHRRAEGGGTS